MVKLKVSQTYNPNKDLLKALRYFEFVKEMAIVKHQKNLLECISKAQHLFAQTLLDCVGVADGGLTAAEKGFARDNQIIPAIKLIRERTGIGIMEAKVSVEKWQRENGVDPCGGQR